MNQSSKVIPTPHPAMPPGEQEVRAALSQLRQKLLDLTARNPLISFKHGKSARYIRIVDELPDRLTEELYAGKSLKFSPISEPDASELASWSPGTTASSIKRPPVETWAAHCGISVSPDLPSRKGGRQHQDLKVQTPYYPNTLESRLANLTKLAHTTVQETGTNFLHLAIGFLVWYESADSEKAHHAPLYIIPVPHGQGLRGFKLQAERDLLAKLAKRG